MSVVALPTSSDVQLWSAEERALVEAAGLVHVDARSGEKTLAERPVVAAFLQHCARTGLDPIARQIYSIARRSKGQLKWQIQISIDGARLVAERSGEYEGQTTPEFTGDGVSWTQVWLSSEPPAAARVGVFRRGFREPLYAVALWEAYVQRTFSGEVSEMWRKMGPLMLAKCAEMLALRKAFPQDLSGLYSAEEMSQADAAQSASVRASGARSVVSGGGVPEAGVSVLVEPSGASEGVVSAAGVAEVEVVEAEVVDDDPTLDLDGWEPRITQCLAEQDPVRGVDMLRVLHGEAKARGLLRVQVTPDATLDMVLRQAKAEIQARGEVR